MDEESASLISRETVVSVNADSGRKSWFKPLASLVVIVMVVAGLFVYTGHNNGANSSSVKNTDLRMSKQNSAPLDAGKEDGVFTRSSKISSTSSSRASSASETSLTNNGYTIVVSVVDPDYGSYSNVEDLPWDMLVEPHRTQTLNLESVTTGGINTLSYTDYTIVWTIDGTTYTKTSTDTSIDLYFTEVGIKSGSISLYATGKTALVTQDFTIAVKYVRREIRTLTDTDRNEFFAALSIIYNDSDTVQSKYKTLYGSKYMSAKDFAAEHLLGAGTTDCDHWHDGAGFLNHHVGFTLQFEQALQAISPKLTVPYWEYSSDAYLYDTWNESKIFDEDWFGESTPTNSDHIIQDGGTWNELEVPSGSDYLTWDTSSTGTLNPRVSAYGALRSPWNNIDDNYVRRTDLTYGGSTFTMPGCTEMTSCYNSDSFSSISDCMNGFTHGPVHILIGGAYNDYVDFSDYSWVEKPGLLLYFKILWRMGFTRCPSVNYCTDNNIAESECVCSIPDSILEEYGVNYIAEVTGFADYAENFGGYNTSQLQDEDLMLTLLRLHEDVGSVGEFFTSNAAFEPLFWPLHGQIERLIGLKRINVAANTTTLDETWGFATWVSGSGGAFLDGICDWSDVSSGADYLQMTNSSASYDMPTCVLHEEIFCDGQNEDDLLEFSGFVEADETYTNKDMYAFIHPQNDYLPYVYDTYDFSYCGENNADEPGVTTTTTTTTTGSTTGASKSTTATSTSSKSGSKKFITLNSATKPARVAFKSATHMEKQTLLKSTNSYAQQTKKQDLIKMSKTENLFGGKSTKAATKSFPKVQELLKKSNTASTASPVKQMNIGGM